jgi:hypothetical protein
MNIVVYNKRIEYPTCLVLGKQLFNQSHIQTNVKFGPLKNFIPTTELNIIVDEKFKSKNELNTIHVEQFMDFTEFMDFIEEYERE